MSPSLVRKLQIQEEKDIKEPYIVEVSRNEMKELNLKENDIFLLRGSKKSNTVCLVKSFKDISKGVICMNKTTIDNLRCRANDYVFVSRMERIPSCRYAVFSTFDDQLPSGTTTLSEQLSANWNEKYIRSYFKDQDIPIHVKNTFIAKRSGSQDVEFMVIKLEPGPYSLVDSKTVFVLNKTPMRRVDHLNYLRAIGYDDIGGYRSQVHQLREVIELPLSQPEVFTHLGIKPPKGVLLYGPPGTGKTLIGKAVANEAGATFFPVSGPEFLSPFFNQSALNLRFLFQEASRYAPSIIFIDEFDSIAPSRDASVHSAEKRVVAQLLTLMDGLVERSRVVVIGATNRPDAIDPALRRGGRFDREIQIGVPSTAERFDILQILTKDLKLNNNVRLKQIAEDTHGFVGADLALLCREAALHRIAEEIGDEDINNISNKIQSLTIDMKDFKFAMNKVGPSALRENMIELPTVTWKDIGGLNDAKKELEDLITLPILYSEKMKRFGLKPPRGILFYGPPGCGKTLLAQAVAGECKANFISVKGPEMLSKYFGESCANVRKLFTKARTAAPCVIFFDELDAISKCRGNQHDSAAADRVTDQLLSELDGITKNNNVYVIGATNRPDTIDPALLRPGRFDQILYIPLPDEAGRLSILKANLRFCPLNKDIKLQCLAKRTHGYSGADLTQLCQKACKLAIKEVIKAEENNSKSSKYHIKLTPIISEIMMKHFEKALEESYRSVSESDIKKYEEFANSFRKSGGNSFKSGRSSHSFYT